MTEYALNPRKKDDWRIDLNVAIDANKSPLLDTTWFMEYRAVYILIASENVNQPISSDAREQKGVQVCPTVSFVKKRYGSVCEELETYINVLTLIAIVRHGPLMHQQFAENRRHSRMRISTDAQMRLTLKI